MIVYCLCGHSEVFLLLICLLSRLRVSGLDGFAVSYCMAAVRLREARNMAFVLGTLTTILFLIHRSGKFFKSSFRQFSILKN